MRDTSLGSTEQLDLELWKLGTDVASLSVPLVDLGVAIPVMGTLSTELLVLVRLGVNPAVGGGLALGGALRLASIAISGFTVGSLGLYTGECNLHGGSAPGSVTNLGLVVDTVVTHDESGSRKELEKPDHKSY